MPDTAHRRPAGAEGTSEAGRLKAPALPPVACPVPGIGPTVAEDFADEQPLLAPLPTERFDPGLVLHPRVDRSALITVRMAKYSVPARLIGHRVRVSLRASELVVFDGRAVVARHGRVSAMGGSSIVLDHYLEVLQTKPGALPGSTALAQARAAGVFTAAHEAFWQQARKVEGDAAGTRALIEVLLLHRSMQATDVIASITRPLPSLAAYDELLQRRSATDEGATTGREGTSAS